MPEGSSPIPIIRTKLHRPPVAADIVPRPRLVERLEEGATRRLTLVCAPAGYGKSTLLSSWLASSPLPSAWLSLASTTATVVGRAKRLIRAFLI